MNFRNKRKKITDQGTVCKYNQKGYCKSGEKFWNLHIHSARTPCAKVQTWSYWETTDGKIKKLEKFEKGDKVNFKCDECYYENEKKRGIVTH